MDDQVERVPRLEAAGPPRRRSGSPGSIFRTVAVSAVTALAAASVLAGVAVALAGASDRRAAQAQRVALRDAVSEYRGLIDIHDERFLRLVAKSAGIAHLRLEDTIEADSADAQPVIDGAGRIAGFIVWRPDTPGLDQVRRSMPAGIVFIFALTGLGGLGWRLRQRSRADLAASEAKARRAAEIDALTGLANRLKMAQLAEGALARRADGETVTFAMFALSGLDAISAMYGHRGADEIIQIAASRLQAAVANGAVCARTGPHDFAVLLPPGADAAAAVRESIEVLSQPHWLNTVVHLSVHAGIVSAPVHANTGDDLMRRAELALREAQKKPAGTSVVFDPSLEVLASDQQFIRRELPRALGANALDVHYQPIVASDGSRITGVEALLRWTHPDRGAISPAQFIPIAEQVGLMDALGTFVLRRALEDARRWPDLYVAVNLSPLQVRDRRIVDVARAALEDTGVAPSRLMLEITEGVLIDNPEQMIERIGELHALGVKIALDDFGSGYSNLGYLQRFNFDKLKVDRSFVSALGKSSNSGVIVQAIVALGRALGVTVLVEGVETEEQRVLLRLAGCDEMQGFLFARPSSATTIDRLMAQRKSGRIAGRGGAAA